MRISEGICTKYILRSMMKAILKYKWDYKLSTETRDVSTQSARNICDPEIPPFSLPAFLKHLIHFIVADD